MFRIGPIARLSLGLVALMISLLVVADAFLGVTSGRVEAQRRAQERVAESLALQITSLLSRGDRATLEQIIQRTLAHDSEMRSITVRRSDGSVVLQRGPAGPLSDAAHDTASTRLRVPVFAGTERWGDIDMRFASAEPTTLRAWMKHPVAQLLMVLGLGGFVLCYAYLRRAMQYLDPLASVPDRVRKAFDSFAEGLLIVDRESRIVLANQAFRRLHPLASGDLNGRKIDALDWLARDTAAAPWAPTLQSGEPVSSRPLELPQPGGESVRLLVSSAAINDNRGHTRGWLITFDNVTAIHRANEDLQRTLNELEGSRRQVEDQNVELRRLASRDPLTGCFNRRVLFEFANDLFTQAHGGQKELCCLMVDIDHFKRFNDSHGHGVGDQVIQAVARMLSAGLRQHDVLGRYGGEEFCVVLPEAAPPDACMVAERLRAHIEAGARGEIQGTEIAPITVSIGVASIRAGAHAIEALIDQADQALYRAKQTGRNRVVLFEAAAASDMPSGQPDRPAKLPV